MIQSIDNYLSQLKKELSGCDRATIQDALSDAEEYLRTALSSAMANDATTSEADALCQIIEKYCGRDTEGMIWIVDKLKGLCD